MECTWNEVLEDLLRDQVSRNAEHTAEFYRSRLHQLADWAVARRITLEEFRPKHLREYLALRREKQVSDSTLRSDCIAARVLTRFAADNRYIPADPLKEYRILKAREPRVTMPTPDDLGALLQATQDAWDPKKYTKVRYVSAWERAFYAARDFALLAVLIECAMRISEALAVRLEDCDLERHYIELRPEDTKGGKRGRMIPISEELVEPIERWMSVRADWKAPTLFVTVYDKQMQLRGAERQFAKYMRFAGLSGFSLHGIRHYSLTQIAEQSVLSAATIAGHRDLRTTMRYTHPDRDQVRSDHAAAAPLSQILAHRRTLAQRRKKGPAAD